MMLNCFYSMLASAFCCLYVDNREIKCLLLMHLSAINNSVPSTAFSISVFIFSLFSDSSSSFSSFFYLCCKFILFKSSILLHPFPNIRLVISSHCQIVFIRSTILETSVPSLCFLATHL